MPDKITFYAIVGGGRTIGNPWGLLRRLEFDGDGYADEGLRVDFSWSFTPLIIEWKHGDSCDELVEVSHARASAIIGYFRRTWPGQAQSRGTSGSETNAPHKITYYAVIKAGESVDDPRGLLRRLEHEDGPSDELLRADSSWCWTPILVEWERGDSAWDLVEVSYTRASTIIEHFRQPGSYDLHEAYVGARIRHAEMELEKLRERVSPTRRSDQPDDDAERCKAGIAQAGRDWNEHKERWSAPRRASAGETVRDHSDHSDHSVHPVHPVLSPDKITYYAVVGPGETVDDPGGLVRRLEHEDGLSDEVLRADFHWSGTPAIAEWERGDFGDDLVEVSHVHKSTIIDYFRHTWPR